MKTTTIAMLSLLVLHSMAIGRMDAASAVRPSRSDAASALLSLPLAFEPNRGQSDPSVKFVAHDLSGGGYTLSLTEDSAIFQTGGPASTTLRMKIATARKAAILGADPLPAKVNYFIGSDPTKWITGAPTYRRVAYKQVYSGIDLFFYGSQRQLEYDFVVAPGADAGQIALEFSGAKPRLDDAGNLEMRLNGQTLRFQKPVVYQSIKGQRKAVAGAYRIHGERVRFELGAYDRSAALVIDPVLQYLTYLGGPGGQIYIGEPQSPCGQCVEQGVAVDLSGNLYVTGYTNSTAFPLENPYQSQYKAIADTVFVAEINPTASALVYSTYLGGSAADYGYAIAVDASGSAYVTGHAFSPDFPATPGAFQTVCGPQPGSNDTLIATCHSLSNAFVTKLAPGGSSLAYSTFVGGGGGSAGANAIAVDSEGRAYIAGTATGGCSSTTISFCFPETSNALLPQSLYNTTINHNASNPNAAFVAVLDAAGANLLYATLFGDKNPSDNVNSTQDFGSGVAVDTSGNFYLVGYGQDPALPTTAGAFQPNGTTVQANGGIQYRGFVAKFSPVLGAGAGASLIYATYLGGTATTGSSGEFVAGIAADAAGNAYVTGVTQSQDFPVTPGANETTDCGPATYECENIGFLSKLNPSGSALVWSTLVGVPNILTGGTLSEIDAPRVDAKGNVYVTGEGSSSYPVVNPVQTSPQTSNGGAFVTRYDPTGSTMTFSTIFYSPSGGEVFPGGIDIDSSGNIYVAGVAGPGLPATAGVFESACAGCIPAFMAKIAAPPPPPTITLVANAESGASTIAPNTWVNINGTNLSPVGDSRTWAPSDFVNGQMPTQLDGVSATVNGIPAYVYYISPTQVNILTAPGALSGPVAVQVTNNGAVSGTFTVQARAEVPSFFVFNGGPYVAATHVNGSLIGPTTLYPGASTPVQPGETVVIYANGFGPTSVTVQAGAETQSGTLSPLPVITIGGQTATVLFAGLVAPGEFQFNVVVPASAGNGDQPIVATYGGLTTQAGALITLQ